MTGRPAPVGSPWPLAGIDLAIFDKDGTLIDFHFMWVDWVRSLADRIAAASGGMRVEDLLNEVMGVDPETGRVLPHGALAATPMVRLRAAVVEALAGSSGLGPGPVDAVEAARIVGEAWHAPDPVDLARPVTDLRALFESLRGAGVRIAVATSDDRGPTERTFAHLGVADMVEALSCADDGHRVKPRPDAVHAICGALGVPEGRAAVIGDSSADLAMGRAAGAGRVIAVLTGVGDRATLEQGADLVLESVADLVAPA